MHTSHVIKYSQCILCTRILPVPYYCYLDGFQYFVTIDGAIIFNHMAIFLFMSLIFFSFLGNIKQIHLILRNAHVKNFMSDFKIAFQKSLFSTVVEIYTILEKKFFNGADCWPTPYPPTVFFSLLTGKSKAIVQN